MIHSQKQRNWRKRIVTSLVCCAAMLGIALILPAFAQAHSASLSWAADSVSGVSYHVWRAPCSAAISGGLCPTASEGTFASIAGAVTTTSYTDSSVVGNTNYSYYVTAFCPSGGSCPSNYSVNLDSAPSNHVGAAIPADPVPAPGTLNPPIIAGVYSSSGNETLTASWGQAGSTSSTFLLADSTGACICQGTIQSADGNYILQWAGATRHNMSLKVCIGAICQTTVIA